MDTKYLYWAGNVVRYFQKLAALARIDCFFGDTRNHIELLNEFFGNTIDHTELIIYIYIYI